MRFEKWEGGWGGSEEEWGKERRRGDGQVCMCVCTCKVGMHASTPSESDTTRLYMYV